jgi:aminopeptidase N
MRRIPVTALALAFAGCLCAVPAAHAVTPDVTAAGQATTQLPRDVRPTHYLVMITPDAAKLQFKGGVVISIDVLRPTSSITLNAIDLAFSRVSLSSADASAGHAASRVQVDADAQTATFSFDRAIVPGRYLLSLDYTGRIGTQATGLFAIDYDTRSGKQRALYTQFENSDARRFIPCWDEPAYKATFDLAVTVPRAQMAVSNMPAAQRTDLGNGLSRVRFAQSPKMSTYLLFFGLGDFDRATTTLGSTEIGVVTQKGKAPQAAFALESARAILREYNDYFGTPYPLPKLDNIASPGSSQFFSAMENWGAIFTFEYSLLLDPAISTQADRQRVFDDEAHEMAHQWFGDLVTMSWWDDIWLNEGFASWMQGRTTEKLHPEWNSALSAVRVRERAMSRDAIATTHPVVQHVETVEQASQAFDAITYSKGESVIRMLEGYVGAHAWRDGVRRYIKAHAHGNTVSDDLWREVEAAAGKPITQIAHEFTLQPGVPLIRVASATCSNGRTTLQLAQGEFSADRPGKTPLSWTVPVIAQIAGTKTQSRTLVAGGKATLDVQGCGTAIVNAGQSGYYRTLYAPAQFASITRDFARLAPIDQLGIMDDTWSLGMAGLQPASDYLDLVQATPADADPQIWSDIARSFDALNDDYAVDARRRSVLRAFAIARLTPVFERVGWLARPGEPDPAKNLREDLIRTLGSLGDPKVIAEARRRYAAQSSDPAAVPAALRKAILAVVARHADAATWERLHAAALAEKTPLIKDDLYANLSSTEDATLARRALDLSLTDEPGATNSARMIAIVSGLHPELAFDFAVADRVQVDAKVDSTSRSRYYPALAANSLDPATIGKVKAFAEAHIAAGSRRAADTAVSTIAYRIMVRNTRLPAIDAWLQRHGNRSSAN